MSKRTLLVAAMWMVVTGVSQRSVAQDTGQGDAREGELGMTLEALFRIADEHNTSIKSFQSTIAETEAGIEMLSRLRPLYMKNWIRKKK